MIIYKLIEISREDGIEVLSHDTRFLLDSSNNIILENPNIWICYIVRNNKINIKIKNMSK